MVDLLPGDRLRVRKPWFGRARAELLAEIRAERDRLLAENKALQERLFKAQDDLVTALDPRARWNIHAAREAEDARNTPTPRRVEEPRSQDLPAWSETLHDHVDVGAMAGIQFQTDNPDEYSRAAVEELLASMPPTPVPPGVGEPPEERQ